MGVMEGSKPQGDAVTRRFVVGGAIAAAGVSGVTAAAAGSDMSLDRVVLDIVRRKHAGHAQPLTVLAPQGSQANLTPVIAAFTSSTGIVVNLELTPPDEVNTELVLDKMLGTAKYDVALPATFALPDLVFAEALAPLDALAGEFEPEEFRSGIIYPVGDRIDDQLFGFQTDGDAYLMFYHKDMMADPDSQARYADQFGRVLDVPTTWTELDRQMAFFHAPDAGRFGGALFRTPSYLVWEWWVRFHAKGIWPLASDMTPQVDSEHGIIALEEMIRASSSLVDAAGTMGLFDNWRRFAQGDVYANIGWGGTQKYLHGPDSKMRNRMVFGPTPGGSVDGEPLRVPYFNWGWNYVVSATSAQTELAYLFSLFASSPRMSTLAVRQRDGFFDPFRPEHYDDPGIVEAYSKPFLEVHRDALKDAIPDLYLKGQSDYFHALSDALDAALQGEMDPEMALRRVAQRWELITSRAGRDQQIGRWRRLRAKYPPHVHRLLRDV